MEKIDHPADPNLLRKWLLNHTHTYAHVCCVIALFYNVWRDTDANLWNSLPVQWDDGVVICLERCADLHGAQLMPLPLTVSCFSTIEIGFTFSVPAHLGSPRKWPLNVCVCVCCLFQSSCIILTSPTDCSDDSWRDTFWRGSTNTAL